MKSSTAFPETGTELQAQPLDALHWLLGAGEHLLLGLALGYVCSRTMRALRLRWTWALCGPALVLLAGGLLGSLAWPVGLASVVAGGIARAGERHDLALTAEMAPEASGPLAAALLLGRAIVRRWRVRGQRWFTGNALLVGYDEHDAPVEVPIQGSAGGAHTLVVGAAGSGKTVTQTWLAVRAIEAGCSAIVIDPKDDPDLAEQVCAAAQRAGKRLFQWSPEGPCVYNPYACGSDSEIADKALAGERFTEPHYQRQAQRFLAKEVRILRRAKAQISLAALAENLMPDRLEMVLRQLPQDEATHADYEYLDGLSARQRSDLSGVRDRLSILAESDVGQWLDPSGRASSFALLDALRTGAVALFRLRSDSRPLIMQMLGGAIVLDLLSATSALQHRRTPSIAVIDEFAALAAPHVGGLFGRARGAGMSLVLGTQEISDLQLPGRENLLRQVAGNLSCTISHRQVNPESAEWVCKLAGRRWSWSTTLSSDGRRTYRPTQAQQLTPEHVSALVPGQAAVIVHDGPTRGVRLTRMLSVTRPR